MRRHITQRSKKLAAITALSLFASVIVAAPAQAVNQRTTSVNGISLLDGTGELQSSFAQGTGFAGDFGGSVGDIARQPNGDIIAIGTFTEYDGTTGLGRIARLHPDGSLDESFVTASNGGLTISSVLRTVALQPDGKILLGGFFPSYGGVDLVDSGYTPRVIRLNSNGSLDQTFTAPRLPTSGSSNRIIFDNVAYQADNTVQRFIVASDYNVYRVNATTGALDTSFSGDGLIDGYYATVAQQTDGKLLIGEYSSCNGSTNGVKRYNSNGTLDTSFSTDGIVPVCNGLGQADIVTISVGSDNKIVFGGRFISVDGTTGFGNIARLNADGSLDTSMTSKPQIDGYVWSVYAQSDGKVVVAGQFEGTGVNFDRVPYGYILRINADGTADTTGYNDGDGYNATTYSLVSDGAGGLWVGGSYTSFHGASDAAPTITLYSNGGEGTMVPVSGDGTITVPECDFTLPGMEFEGWNDDEIGEGEWYYPGDTVELTEDLSLYAQWRSGGPESESELAPTGADLSATSLSSLVAMALVALAGVAVITRRRITKS